MYFIKIYEIQVIIMVIGVVFDDTSTNKKNWVAHSAIEVFYIQWYTTDLVISDDDICVSNKIQRSYQKHQCKYIFIVCRVYITCM